MINIGVLGDDWAGSVRFGANNKISDVKIAGIS